MSGRAPAEWIDEVSADGEQREMELIVAALGEERLSVKQIVALFRLVLSSINDLVSDAR